MDSLVRHECPYLKLIVVNHVDIVGHHEHMSLAGQMGDHSVSLCQLGTTPIHSSFFNQINRLVMLQCGTCDKVQEFTLIGTIDCCPGDTLCMCLYRLPTSSNHTLSLWINGKNWSLQVVLQTSSGNCVPGMNESEWFDNFDISTIGPPGWKQRIWFIGVSITSTILFPGIK